MSSSLVGDQFNSFFQRALKKSLLQREKRRMNATLVRKSFVSGSRQDHVSASAPGLKSRLSSMMCHSENTADRDYFLQDKLKNVSKTFHEINSIMRDRSHEDNDSHQTILKKVFHFEINSNEVINLNTVRSKADHLIKLPFSEKQIRDKLRYFQKVGNEEKSLPDDRADNAVDGVDSKGLDLNEKECRNEADDGENGKKSDDGEKQEKGDEREETDDERENVTSEIAVDEYSSDDTQRKIFRTPVKIMVRQKFKHILKPKVLIREKDVLKVAEKESDVREFVNKYGIKCLITKIRTEKRKLLNKR